MLRMYVGDDRSGALPPNPGHHDRCGLPCISTPLISRRDDPRDLGPVDHRSRDTRLLSFIGDLQDIPVLVVPHRRRGQRPIVSSTDGRLGFKELLASSLEL